MPMQTVNEAALLTAMISLICWKTACFRSCWWSRIF